MTAIDFSNPPWILVDGLPNARDLGDGARVRTGRVFRSGTSQDLTPEGLEFLVEKLGVRTVLDLRVETEIERNGRGPLAGEARLTHKVLAFGEDPANQPSYEQYMGDPDVLGSIYEMAVDQGAAQIAMGLTAIADACHEPVLFHCQAGQDRTGVLAAALLDLLGAGDDAVVADYLLTLTWLEHLPEEIAEHRRQVIASLGLPPGIAMPSAASIQRFLTRARAEHGSIEGMLIDAGLAPEAIATLRAELLLPGA